MAKKPVPPQFRSHKAAPPAAHPKAPRKAPDNPSMMPTAMNAPEAPAAPMMRHGGHVMAAAQSQAEPNLTHKSRIASSSIPMTGTDAAWGT